MKLMKQIISDIKIKNDCSLFKKGVINVTFQNCSFDNLVLSDIAFENLEFNDCEFNRVLIESFYAKNIRFNNSKINYISLRGARFITKRRFFGRLNKVGMERVEIDNSNYIKEITLGGGIHMKDCSFPSGPNYLHLKNPFKVYTKCFKHVDEHWAGEKKRIGLEAIQTIYLAKDVMEQAENFIVYSPNDYLDKDINDILESLFHLIREFSYSNSDLR
jgi:hypothetical protein